VRPFRRCPSWAYPTTEVLMLLDLTSIVLIALAVYGLIKLAYLIYR
jgi:hypothetical protein